jgi:hypothetical protein
VMSSRRIGPKDLPREQCGLLGLLLQDILELRTRSLTHSAGGALRGPFRGTLEIEGGSYAFKNQASGEATGLPATVTEWNASTVGEGRLALDSSRPVRE